MTDYLRIATAARAVRRIATCAMIHADSRQPSPMPLEALVTPA